MTDDPVGFGGGDEDGLLCGCGRRVRTPFCPWCGRRLDDAALVMLRKLADDFGNAAHEYGREGSADSRAGRITEAMVKCAQETVAGSCERALRAAIDKIVTNGVEGDFCEMCCKRQRAEKTAGWDEPNFGDAHNELKRRP